jgi:hypothetical protein
MSSRLREALAAPDSKSRHVRRLFSTIAERYPGALEVNAMIGRAGFSLSEYLPVFGGLMAIHHARR